MPREQAAIRAHRPGSWASVGVSQAGSQAHRNPFWQYHLRPVVGAGLGSDVLPGIVLAAGDSIRMGSPKALLPSPDGRPFVARIVDTLREAGVAELVVVTGRDHDALVNLLSEGRRVPPLFARNVDPSRGQLSSLWAGMDAVVNSDTEGILVTLVDVPMVAVSTVTRRDHGMAAYARTNRTSRDWRSTWPPGDLRSRGARRAAWCTHRRRRKDRRPRA